MEHSTYFNPPKKKEESEGQVPTLNIAEEEEETVEDDYIMDDLEGILGIEDYENLALAEEQGIECLLFEDAEICNGIGNSYVGVKAESEYWDFDERKASLNLSLNYQEVLQAWSNRSPLCAPGSNTYMGEVPVMEEEQEGMWSRRQASVMRYKEKRQSRLFSKKIRYEVRKLNADNRPRIKGRFVKRLGDKMQKGSLSSSSAQPF